MCGLSSAGKVKACQSNGRPILPRVPLLRNLTSLTPGFFAARRFRRRHLPTCYAAFNARGNCATKLNGPGQPCIKKWRASEKKWLRFVPKDRDKGRAEWRMPKFCGWLVLPANRPGLSMISSQRTSSLWELRLYRNSPKISANRFGQPLFGKGLGTVSLRCALLSWIPLAFRGDLL